MYNLSSYGQVCIINIFKYNKDHPEPNMNLLYDLSLESAALKLVFSLKKKIILIEMVRESQLWILNTVKTVVAYRASLEHLGAIVDVLCGPFLLFT